MPKMKTHSGAKKRFIVNKKGKVKHKKAGLRHLMTGMDANRGRKLRRASYLNTKDSKAIKAAMPYA
jgi:large subunit ribosomal protein L35